MQFKFQSWAQAAAAHLTQQIVGGLQGLCVEALGGVLGEDGKAMARRFMDACNNSPPGIKAVIDQALLAASELAWPEVLSNRVLWPEIERGCEIGLADGLTEKLHAMPRVGDADLRLHRVRLVVKRPYDQPLIISGDGEDLVVLDSSHRVGRGAWGPHLLEDNMSLVHRLMMDAYLGEDWRDRADRDLADAYNIWLVDFLATAPPNWTLTGPEIHAAMCGKGSGGGGK